jgi:hypothetical protein
MPRSLSDLFSIETETDRASPIRVADSTRAISGFSSPLGVQSTRAANENKASSRTAQLRANTHPRESFRFAKGRQTCPHATHWNPREAMSGTEYSNLQKGHVIFMAPLRSAIINAKC